MGGGLKKSPNLEFLWRTMLLGSVEAGLLRSLDSSFFFFQRDLAATSRFHVKKAFKTLFILFVFLGLKNTFKKNIFIYFNIILKY